ncbi:TRP-domain-containing protein, partial [Polychaeton citri CBS 116435]
DNRQPSIYTGNYGNCLGADSSIELTRFDAAYYRDNMTVLFHLEGSSPLNNQTLMMYIGVFAYGESRFDLVFNPCQANIQSLCPLNTSIPISANGIIPINQNDVANIPTIAYSIPDFEGQAILRIFANNTQSEIGCYSAVLTNGKSFKQVDSVGSVLGIFTLLAMLASFATAIYGESVPTMRLHYAHSLSVGVVFAVWQHIFFTGALSVNWPSVLVAWWSNFAWAGGMIYSSSMQSSIDKLIGNKVGNTSSLGAASSGSRQDGLGGGVDLSQLYGRAILPALKRAQARLVARDATTDAIDGYLWHGDPVQQGLPLPGNYSGFPGTLAEENIRASNAFMTGFLWFLILLVILVAATIAFKWVVEGMAKVKLLRHDRLAYFRQHWIGYSALVALRTCFVAFFMLMFLTLFQFTYDASGGVVAVAAIVFIIFLVGISGAAAYAIWYRCNVSINGGSKQQTPSEKKKLLGMPWFGSKKSEGPAPVAVTTDPIEEKVNVKPALWKRMSSMGSMPTIEQSSENINDDADYMARFGWLGARFRRTRWWFFAAWVLYEFIRACFYGAASSSPQTQVFGLLVVEVLAFIFIVWARPFEGVRLNVILVYLLGISKVACTGISVAFLIQFELDRIITTVLGIVIIVIQGVLTVVTLIAVVVGLWSTYMSLSRNSEDFRPRKWSPLREKYFNHLDRVVNDVPREKKPKKKDIVEEEPKVGFEMKGARRLAKIEDEDADFTAEMANESDPALANIGMPYRTSTDNAKGPSGYATPVGRSRAASRANSIRSVRSNSSLPYGARSHRPSWT